MKKLILIVLIVIIGWQAYTKDQVKPLALANAQVETLVADATPTPQSPAKTPPSQSLRYPVDTPSSHNFTCDGRTYCSQMTSCEEATFFLSNCPGVKMDGNHDGVPCEMQWCN